MFGVENGCVCCACAVRVNALTHAHASPAARPHAMDAENTPLLLICSSLLVGVHRARCPMQRGRRDTPPDPTGDSARLQPSYQAARGARRGERITARAEACLLR